MVAVPSDKAEIEFKFVGITNLVTPTSMHMHEYVFGFHDDADRVDATWVLWDDGAEAERRFFSLERTAAPAS